MTKHRFSLGVFYNADCFEVLPRLRDSCVDMILADLPYGITQCAWDSALPFDALWDEYLRVAKPDAAIVLTASQPFTSALVMSRPRLFRHEWIYKKRRPSNFAQAKIAPMKEHESVLVFSRKTPRYFPIKEARQGSGSARVAYKFSEASAVAGRFVADTLRTGKHRERADALRYPSSIQEFNNAGKGNVGLHPTQKPVELFEYLIRTYTRPGEVVLDNTAGSGTTAVAAYRCGRRWICIEKDPEYFERAVARVDAEDFG